MKSSLNSPSSLTSKLRSFKDTRKEIMGELDQINDKAKVLDSLVQTKFDKYETDWEILNPLVKKIEKMAESMAIVDGTKCFWYQLESCKGQMSEAVERIKKSIKDLKKDQTKVNTKVQEELT